MPKQKKKLSKLAIRKLNKAKSAMRLMSRQQECLPKANKPECRDASTSTSPVPNGLSHYWPGELPRTGEVTLLKVILEDSNGGFPENNAKELTNTGDMSHNFIKEDSVGEPAEKNINRFTSTGKVTFLNIIEEDSNGAAAENNTTGLTNTGDTGHNFVKEEPDGEPAEKSIDPLVNIVDVPHLLIPKVEPSHENNPNEYKGENDTYTLIIGINKQSETSMHG